MDGCSLESESSVDHKSFLRMPEVLWLLYLLNCVYFDYIKFHVLRKKTLTAYKTDCDNPSKSIKADESQSIPR